MVGKICEIGRSWDGSKQRELWMVRVVSWWESEDVAGAWTGKSQTEGLEWGWQRELGSWSKHGEAYLKQQSVTHNEDDVGGQVRVMTDEEWVLRQGWTEMSLRRYEGWVVVRTLWVSERSLYLMCLVMLSQWREHKIGLMWHDLGALTTARAREFWICWRWVICDLGRL